MKIFSLQLLKEKKQQSKKPPKHENPLEPSKPTRTEEDSDQKRQILKKAMSIVNRISTKFDSAEAEP